MSEHIRIHEYPIFEKGIFKENPALFDPYFRNIPEHQKKKYEIARGNISKYEERYKWQLIEGPGFCGAVNPGTGKVFHGVMTGSTHPVYNSDCLYVNTTKNIFAISDPPGITEFSRHLITRLDELLKSGSVDNLESMINEVNLNAGTGLRDRATLALVHFLSNTPEKAMVLHCGDSYLFIGNTITQKISRIEAEAHRWGTLNAQFKLKEIDITEGDFIIIASDGISAIRSTSQAHNLDSMLLNLVNTDADNFAFDVISNCNEIVEQESAGRTRTTFGCGDDLSAILIDPSKLKSSEHNDSYIFGGYVEWKTL